MSAVACETLYIGNITQCNRLMSAGDTSTAMVCDLNVDVSSLPTSVTKVYLILNQLSEVEANKCAAVCQAIKKHLPHAQVCQKTVETLQADVARVAWQAKNGDTFANIPTLPLDEEILPCSKMMDKPSDKWTREWYINLLNFALNKVSVSKMIYVVHGASGVGKSLAISRIGQILDRERKMHGRRDELLVISAASINPDAIAALMTTMIVHGRHPNNIIAIDDFDAGVPEKMLEQFERLKCRRIVVCNDPYTKTNRALRKVSHYHFLEVRRVHPPSLLAYLQRHFPQFNTREAREQNILEDIVAASRGDVRVALTSARWRAIQDTKTDDGGEKSVVVVARDKDVCRIGEPPNVAILHCSKAANVVDACEKKFGEGDVESRAELLFENHPLYNTSDLSAAQSMLELQSFADTYDTAQRNCAREGSDAHITDKKMHFELAFVQPMLLLSKVTKTHPSAPSGMLMRFGAQEYKTKQNGAAMRRARLRKLVHDSKIDATNANVEVTPVLEMRAADSKSDLLCLGSRSDRFDTAIDYPALMFGGQIDMKEVAKILTHLVRVDPENPLPEATMAKVDIVKRAMQRCAMLGLCADDFIYQCEKQIALSGFALTLPSGLEEVFNNVVSVLRRKTATATAAVASSTIVDDFEDAPAVARKAPTKTKTVTNKKRKAETESTEAAVTTAVIVETTPKKAKSGHGLLDRFLVKNAPKTK